MKQWLTIRHDLYAQIRKRVELLLGKTPPSFARYQESYERSFLVKWKASSKEDLLFSIEHSKVILMADFHALQQSQKAHLRVLQALPKKTLGVLAVEFFEQRHQESVDAYIAGEISEKELLSRVEWQKSWGFPWEHYRPLLRWAQKHRWPVLCLNHLTGSQSVASLQMRDRKAASRILEVHRKHPQRKIFVVFGDLHLASDHLPKELLRGGVLKEREVTSIFQNSERIYFQLLKKNLEMQVDVVQLKARQFCLMNVPPWVKWQNYLLFLEQRFDFDIGEEAPDLTDEVVRYLDLLTKDLGFSPVSRDHFSIYTAESPAFWTKMQKICAPEELKYFESLVENNVSFYLHQGQIGFLAQASVNHAAVLAMAILQAEISGTRKYPAHLPHDFLSLIWLEAVLYFGSKIINPKRKTDTLWDLRASLNNLLLRDLEKEVLKLALQQKMKEILYLSQGKKSKDSFLVRRKSSYREAARLLGGMLGEKLYFASRKQLISKMTLQNLLSKRLDHDGFKNVYFEILEMVELLPEPFHSKQEKL